MNTSQINCFLVASECLNFTKAAERLFMSQTGLSRQIAALERELNVELFERIRNSLRLTDAGKVCVTYLTKIRSDLLKMSEEASVMQRRKLDSIVIGGIEGQLIGKHYENAMTYFWANQPNTKIKMFYYNISELCRALVEGDVDLGIMPEEDAKRIPGILYKRSNTAKGCLVVRENHPMADKENATLRDFRDETFLVLAESESGSIGSQHRRICQAAGFTPKQHIVPNFSTLVMLLEMGVGISVMNVWNSLRNAPHLRFLELADLGYTIEAVAWLKDNRNPNIPVFLDKAIGSIDIQE